MAAPVPMGSEPVRWPEQCASGLTALRVTGRARLAVDIDSLTGKYAFGKL